MLSDNYKCDGQIDMETYLTWLSEQTEKCIGCIYFKDYKCVRRSCHKILESEGWIPLWTDERNRNHGQWPTCMYWCHVETINEDRGEFFESDARAKDKTFIWAKDSKKAMHHYSECIAWRYKGEQ